MHACFLAAFVCAAMNAAPLPYPALKRDGNVLPSVCVPTELQALKKQFARYKYKQETQAWKAVTTLLCGSRTEENTRYIKRMMRWQQS